MDFISNDPLRFLIFFFIRTSWKKREQLLDQVIKNTSGMYGDLGGILGGKLEKVEYLELGGGIS